MKAEALTAERVADITGYVDAEAPSAEPSAHIVFGGGEPAPALLVAERHHQGLAPLIILSGGAGRPNLRRLLRNRDVPKSAIRTVAGSPDPADTWRYVERALPHLREAAALGLPITAVCRWYERGVIHTLRTLLPEVGCLYASTWEPVYAGTMLTRANWPLNPDGLRQVLMEWREVPRLVADGSFKEVHRVAGVWL